MASLVLKMSVSLDGFVAPLDGTTDGSLWDVPMTAPVALVETLSNAAALVGATTYAAWAADLARRLRAVRMADERDPQGRVLELAYVR